MRLLLSYGADPTKIDDAKRYAIDVIYENLGKCQQNQYSIVKALYDAMKQKGKTDGELEKYKSWLDDDKNKQTAQETQPQTERPTSIAFVPRAARAAAKTDAGGLPAPPTDISPEKVAARLLVTRSSSPKAASVPIGSVPTGSPQDIIKQELAKEQAKAASPASSPAEKRAASVKVEELRQDLDLIDRAQAVLESSEEAVRKWMFPPPASTPPV